MMATFFPVASVQQWTRINEYGRFPRLELHLDSAPHNFMALLGKQAEKVYSIHLNDNYELLDSLRGLNALRRYDPRWAIIQLQNPRTEQHMMEQLRIIAKR